MLPKNKALGQIQHTPIEGDNNHSKMSSKYSNITIKFERLVLWSQRKTTRLFFYIFSGELLKVFEHSPKLQLLLTSNEESNHTKTKNKIYVGQMSETKIFILRTFLDQKVIFDQSRL